jgi:hypothetical protein
MTRYLRKLTSRKFQAFLGAALMTVGTALAGEIPWGLAVQLLTAQAASYILGEGAVDVAGRLATGLASVIRLLMPPSPAPPDLRQRVLDATKE